MLTLHTYLARELLKTFGLTSVALTLLVVMGGGVANIFRGEGLGAEDVFKVFLFLTPVAITLILPVAALFSAAITYGRASADNEITACRAAGINIHRLLLSAGLLGLFVTIFTYVSWNFMIPGLSRMIEETTRRELPGIVMGQFQKARPLAFGKYRITAGRCEIMENPPPGIVLPEDHTYLLLSKVSFLEMGDEEYLRYGTADATIIDFDGSGDTPRVTVDLQGVRTFDASRRQYYDLAHQVLGPFDVPMPMRRKTKFENLARLVHYQRHPAESPEIEDRLFGIRRELMSFYVQQEAIDRLAKDGVIKWMGPGVQYEISARQYAVDPDDGRTTLRDVRVVEVEDPPRRDGDGMKQVMTAESATLDLRSAMDKNRPLIMVELIGNVETRTVAPARRDNDRTVRKTKESLKPLEYMDQPGLVDRLAQFDTKAFLQGTPIVGLPRKQHKQCERFWQRLDTFRAEVIGEIHFRGSYALTPVAVVLMGAILGIIIRGGQVLTAFGISCVPSLFVVLISIVGRNLADRPDYSTVSLFVMWGGTAFIYLATAFVAFKVLKR